MPVQTSGLPPELVSWVVASTSGITVALLAGPLRQRVYRYVLPLAEWGLPVIGGLLVAGLVLVAFGPAVTAARAVASGSGVLLGDEATLFEHASDLRHCEHRNPQSDAIAELYCGTRDEDNVSLYLFVSSTASSAWFERQTRHLQADTSCPEQGRGTWSYGNDGDAAGQLACYVAKDQILVLWTEDGGDIGGQLSGPMDDPGAALAAWQRLALRRPSPPKAGICTPSVAPAWDEGGNGHDRWDSSSLSLAYVAPCTTVMVSSGELQVPGGPPCKGDQRTVCVLAWFTSTGGSFEVSGLEETATWWSYAEAPPKVAIEDKADQYNAKGWFGSRNCSTGSGCDSAVVWIVNDGSITSLTIRRP